MPILACYSLIKLSKGAGGPVIEPTDFLMPQWNNPVEQDTANSKHVRHHNGEEAWGQMALEAKNRTKRRHLDTHRSRSCTEKQQALRRLSLKAAVSGHAIRPDVQRNLEVSWGQAQHWRLDGTWWEVSEVSEQEECTWLLATDLFKGFCPRLSQTGGAVLKLRGCLGGWDVLAMTELTISPSAGSDWFSEVQKALWHPRLWDTENMA